ncbi:MAG: HAMP domain-containing histidine kinase [Candidatus Gastranaerophilales bacterium]|nr:HAMP domain-containing histidine kinase [Candidatus Gastranaerophilales bacterium]
MKTLILVSLISFFVLLISLLAIVLIVKYARLSIKYKRISKYLHSYLNTIIGARYGNLLSRCDDGVDALTIQLSKNTNAFLESVIDRDEMIKEYIEREKQAQNIKQDFVSSLAHDLKVPIIAQDNTFELFLNGKFGEITKTQEDVLKNLKLSNSDLKNFIINLLDVYKLDNESIKPEFKETNINELILEVIEQNKNVATIQNKKLFFIPKKEEIYSKIDSFLIKRVLNNLISNAFSHTKQKDEIEIILNKKGAKLEILVKDSGTGIKEEEINKIFKKYYTSTKKYSNIGLGLGLYIANKIIEAHNGKIKVSNNETKGACFCVSLPILK